MIRGAMAWLLLAGPAMAGAPVFVDRSGDLPVAHAYTGGWEHFVGGGVAVFDCDGDHLPEFLAAGGEGPTRLFLNRTAGPAAPLTFAAGALPEIAGVTGAYPLDIDGDGPLDLVVLTTGSNRLLRGDGACGFVDVTEAWGFAGGDRWSTAMSATWEDGQDWPTLAIGNYVDRDDPEGPFGTCDANELHRPDGQRYGAPILLEPGFCALSILISDWSRSGRRDLRLSNDRHYYLRGGSEQMWRLDTLSLLTEADGWQDISIWGMGIASQDLTGDGRPEVFLTSMGDQLMKIATDGPGYEAAPYEIGTYAQRPHLGDDGRPSTGWHAQFGDVDNDSRPDLFIAKGNVDQMPGNAMRDPNNLLMQQPDGTFREASVEAGVATVERSRGAALADLDGDGRLDLIVVNRRAPLELYQNATPDAGNWLAVGLHQPGGNGRAVGAWVETRAPDGRVSTQELTVGGGHAGGQAGPLHFGLGADGTVEVRVIWPDGAASDWASVAANRRLTLGRGEGAALIVGAGD